MGKYSLALILLLAALLAPVGAAAQVQDVASGLVSCWQLNEESGVRSDYWGSNHLTDNNTVTFAAGHILTNAAQMVAANTEYLDIVDNATLDFSGEFTAAAWVRFDSMTGSRGIFGNNFGSAVYWRLRHDASPRWSFATYDGSSSVTGVYNGGAVDTWYFVLLERNNITEKVQLWLDNSMVKASGVTGIGSWENTDNFAIGRSNAGAELDGRIGPAYLWNRVLTTEEKTWLYNGGTGRDCSETTGLTIGQEYSTTSVDLPSGHRGSIANLVTVGDVLNASGILALVVLGIFWVMRDTVRSSKVGDK